MYAPELFTIETILNRDVTTFFSARVIHDSI